VKKYLIVISLLAFFWPMALQAETNTVTSTVTGTTTVDKTPPTASAPNVMINNQDVCSTGTSAAVQTQVLGIAGGTTIRDLNCERLKLSRALYGMGMKVAAVSLVRHVLTKARLVSKRLRLGQKILKSVPITTNG
jgi:hypothetical protein